MANLFKKNLTKTDPKTGKKKKSKSRKWWGKYRDALGATRRKPLCTDKGAAQTMLNELVKKAERERAGMVSPFDEHLKNPITKHLVDFEKHLADKGSSPFHVETITKRATKIVEECKFKMIGDLSASRVETFLAELRRSGKSIQTSNHYLQAIKAIFPLVSSGPTHERQSLGPPFQTECRDGSEKDSTPT